MSNSRASSKNRIKIVLVGGGSFGWAPALCRDILLTPSLGDNCDIVLYDIKKENSDITKSFLDRLARDLGAKSKFISADRRDKAFAGADYFIITIATGRPHGLDAMAHDIKIPEKYGIYHTVGDTSGPGGWARTIRNFQVFVDLAKAFNKHAPNAPVLNYTNPMSTLTDVLAQLCKGPVVGLCHGLFENLDFIKRYYKLDSEDEIAAKYAGLNHFFWMTECKAGKIDVIADLKRKLKRKSLVDLLYSTYEDPMGHFSNRELANELFKMTGVMPYIGDRHTCEFLPSFINNKDNMKKYKLIRTKVSDRKKGYAKAGPRLQKAAVQKKKLDEKWYARSRETATNIIDAHLRNKTFIDVGNTPNIGQVSNLPLGAVLETAVRVDRNGFTPLAFGDLPDAVLAMIEPVSRVFTMTVDACFAGDLKLALQALRLDPVCSHLNNDQVEQMGRQLLQTHKRFIKCF